MAVPIVFVPVLERRTGKNRVHLDLASASAADQAELVSRARDLGGGQADIGQGDVPWVVMADPEGNEFCILGPRDVYRDTGPVAAILTDCAEPAALARFWAGAAAGRSRGPRTRAARRASLARGGGAVPGVPAGARR